MHSSKIVVHHALLKPHLNGIAPAGEDIFAMLPTILTPLPEASWQISRRKFGGNSENDFVAMTCPKLSMMKSKHLFLKDMACLESAVTNISDTFSTVMLFCIAVSHFLFKASTKN
mmetsp:Transcript_30091/g.39616  ORF Transcript_30091/g.39616 Transcript_30091/m.39616 type:complete len:115 (+) Transcript_30091:166-510(+)